MKEKKLPHIAKVQKNHKRILQRGIYQQIGKPENNG